MLPEGQDTQIQDGPHHDLLISSGNKQVLNAEELVKLSGKLAVFMHGLRLESGFPDDLHDEAQLYKPCDTQLPNIAPCMVGALVSECSINTAC